MISPNTDSAINIPAVAAALVTKAYHASDFDELELKVLLLLLLLLLLFNRCMLMILEFGLSCIADL